MALWRRGWRAAAVMTGSAGAATAVGAALVELAAAGPVAAQVKVLAVTATLVLWFAVLWLLGRTC